MAPNRALQRPLPDPDPQRVHGVYEKGYLRVDFDAYEVCIDAKPVHLSLRDFQLLRFFTLFPERVFRREQILEQVWGSQLHVEPRTVDVHVRNLRACLERDPTRPELILTVRGVGYRFNERALTTPSR